MANDNEQHKIVVVGGNFAGLGAVHYLLRHTIPSLKRIANDKQFHITLVTPNTHAYFKIAAPRALVQPDVEQKLWRPLSEALSQYPTDEIKVVQATATGLDPAKRAVSVAFSKPNASEEQTIFYDSLVIATGTTSTSALWTLKGDQSLTSEAFESVRKALPKAKTVYVAGGGAVGIETTGEIASNHPSASVTLLSGGPRLLQRVRPQIGDKAQTYLQNSFGVTVIHDVKVLAATSSSAADGQGLSATTLSLSNNETKTVDLYIDATGGLPNSQFLPTSWLDDTKRVNTRDAYFRVKGSGNGDSDGVYVVGDIVAGSNNTAMEVDAMVPTACSAIAMDIAVKLKGPPHPGLKEFKPIKDSILVPVGAGGGVGQLFGWRIPSFLVKLAKSKTFLIDLFDPMVTGSKWKA